MLYTIYYTLYYTRPSRSSIDYTLYYTRLYYTLYSSICYILYTIHCTIQDSTRPSEVLQPRPEDSKHNNWEKLMLRNTIAKTYIYIYIYTYI